MLPSFVLCHRQWQVVSMPLSEWCGIDQQCAEIRKSLNNFSWKGNTSAEDLENLCSYIV